MDENNLKDDEKTRGRGRGRGLFMSSQNSAPGRLPTQIPTWIDPNIISSRSPLDEYRSEPSTSQHSRDRSHPRDQKRSHRDDRDRTCREERGRVGERANRDPRERDDQRRLRVESSSYGNKPTGSSESYSRAGSSESYSRTGSSESYSRRGGDGPSSRSPVNIYKENLVPERSESRSSFHRPESRTVTSNNPRDVVASSSTSALTRSGIHNRSMLAQIVNSKPAQLTSKKGTSGLPVTLQCNYFRLLKTPTWSLYQYRVDFSPEIESTSIKKGLLKIHKNFLKGYLFDGTVLFLSQKLKHDNIELTSKLNTTNENITITIKLVGIISMKESSSLQVLNLILRSVMGGLNLQLVGKNFYDATAKIQIDKYHLQLWPGYVTSIRQHEKDILLCTEITHKVMRTETVYDILLSQSKNRDFQNAFMKTVIGMTVLTDYNNHTYRIDDVDFETNPLSKFETKTGEISFKDYYANRYNINIRNNTQPMLVSKSKSKSIRNGEPEFIRLVPELCRVTGLAEDMKTNFHLMRDLAVHTRVNPGARIQKLLNFNKRLTYNKESVEKFTSWQMKLDTKLVDVLGRELNRESICYGGGVKIKTDKKADWTNEFRSQKMFESNELSRWFIIVPNRNGREAEAFWRCLQNVGHGLGFNIRDPNILTVPDDRSSSYLNALNSCCNNDPQLIMCVVPNNRADRYSAIKKMCCVERSIPSQVMCLRTITPKNGNMRSLMSVATKVAIQLNTKLGCSPWMIELPVSGLMTIGFDVCHDTCDKRKSYGAMVATMDLRVNSKYYSCVTPHTNGEEFSNSISFDIIKAIHQFRELHNILPKKILIYRDGVGDGQLNFVHEFEVNRIVSQLQTMYEKAGESLKLAFIVVTKRINTKIFNCQQNPSTGTVVDDVITLPERYDFYLVSQNVNQGSASPTAYNVLYDTIGLTPDHIQVLTYKMCHIYYNWFGTTRVPAVCQYAHKLATLVGQHIHQDPSHLLERQLYFL